MQKQVRRAAAKYNMGKYYVIKNENERYLKVRTGTNGSKRNWVQTLKGASVFTYSQAVSYKDTELTKSPYFNNLKIVEIGEGHSAWVAKLKAIKK